MNLSTFNKPITIIFVLSFLSFFGSILQSLYVYDGHHWGLMASGAYELLDNKIPYKEIFIQYGILTTVLHSISLKIFSLNVISIFYVTCFIYSISIIFFYIVIKNNSNENFGLFSVICLLLIHPFVNHPWHNYITFLFLLVSLFFLQNVGNRAKIISGIFFALAVLSYEKFFLIFFIFLLTIFFIGIKNRSLKKFSLFTLGAIIPLIIFFSFIINKKIFSDWLNFISISDLYLNENYIILILNFIKKIFTYSIFNFAYEPYWLFFLSLIILNCIFVFNCLFNKDLLEKKEFVFYCAIISLACYSSAVHSLNSFRLATGSILGILVLIFYLQKITNSETRYALVTSILLVLCLGINLKKSENNKLYIHTNIDGHYESNKIKFFENFRWKDDTWKNLIFLEDKIKKINNQCPSIQYAINFTNDSYYYLMLTKNFKTFQKMPWFNTKRSLDNETMKLINPFFRNNYVKALEKKNVVIITNDSFYFIKNYNEIKMPYSYEHKNNKILIPANCLIKS